MKNKGYKKIGTVDGKNKYEVYIECGFDEFGKRIRIHRYHVGNKESAEIWYAELVKEHYHKGKKVNLNDMTFNEYTKIFIEKYCVPNIGKVTIKDYRQMLKRILPIIGDVKLKKLTAFMLDDMYNTIRKGIKGKELSPKSMSHYYNLISVMLKQAKKWKFIEINPNEDATKPKLVKSKRNFYETNQALQLLECLKQENIKVRTLITLALNTGARKSELCALRWNDINFEEMTLFIDNSLKVIDGIVDEENAKTEYSIRTVELGIDMINTLKEYKKWQNEYISNKGDKWQGTDRVFTSINGKHMHPDTPNKILQKVLKKYHLPKLTFHELRHTYASILNSNGIDPKTISEQLGHSDTSVTMNIYTHSFESKKRESANVFDRLQKEIKNA